MSATDSRAQIDDLYAATKKKLAGSWDVGGQTWLECTTASGTTGVSYNLLSQRLSQPLPSSPEPLTNDVQTLWKSLGFDAKISVDNSLTPPHYILSDPAFGSGSGADGFLAQLTVSEKDVTFNGTSRCVSGDIDKLNAGE